MEVFMMVNMKTEFPMDWDNSDGVMEWDIKEDGEQVSRKVKESKWLKVGDSWGVFGEEETGLNGFDYMFIIFYS